MKLLERHPDKLVFGLAAREKSLLERLLTFYPLRDTVDPTISRDSSDTLQEASALLREALQEQRNDLSAWIRRRVVEGEALKKEVDEWHLHLDGMEPEHLLQVLNELRVGAWTKLGSPEDLHDEEWEITPGKAPLHVIMTLAGQFEMVLIHALMGESGLEPYSNS